MTEVWLKRRVLPFVFIVKNLWMVENDKKTEKF